MATILTRLAVVSVLLPLLVALALPAKADVVASTACSSAGTNLVFTDVGTADRHRAAVSCMAGWGIVRGYDDGTFRPAVNVERAQLATFLYRLLRTTDAAPATVASRFADVPVGHAHGPAIGALATAGVINGVTATVFAPHRPVTRGQLATMIVRTQEQVLGSPFAAAPAAAPDDVVGTTHEVAVTRLMGAGIVAGHVDGTFRPDANVTRAQMATFLARYTDLLVRDGRAAPPAESAAPVAEPVTTPGTTVTSPFAGRRQFGVATSSNGWNADELAHIAAVTGQNPDIVLHYLGFHEELQAQQLDNVASRGAMSLLTWEPFDWRAGTVDQPRYALRNIAEGRFDDYLTRTARTLGAFDGPVLLRFAHEMNGAWYPWSERVNGNGSGDYIAAWQHVHDLFERLGVDNVHWVWSPNVEFPGSQPLAELYPGHRYVDVIALDGYNWGDVPGGAGWQSPGQVFDATLSTVRRLSPGTPLMIGETASSELGGSKSAWNTALFSWLETQPDIEALVWFHLDKEADWRIDSSQTSAARFGDGLRRWING